MRAPSWASGLIAALLLSTIAIGGVVAYRANQRPVSLYATAELPRLDGRGTIRLTDLRGHPLVLNFFASWCPSCVAEMPEFDRAYRDAGGNLYMVGINALDTPSAGLEMARRVGVSYPLALDVGNHLYDQLQGQGMPITAFYRPDGSLARVYNGALDRQLLLQIISTLG